MEHLLQDLPRVILVIIAIMWAAEKFILPFFRQFGEQRSSEVNLAQIKSEIIMLKKELHEWERRYGELDESYRTLQIKYTNIMGMLRGFQIYLKDKGMADFPMMDDLIRHAEEAT